MMQTSRLHLLCNASKQFNKQATNTKTFWSNKKHLLLDNKKNPNQKTKHVYAVCVQADIISDN